MTDVLVVGGGPAGSVLAGLLARAGAQVRLLDAARFPRPKPCGECLNPGAVAALHRLGLWDEVAPLGPASLTGWRLCACPGRTADADFPVGHKGVAVDRRRFDHALLRWAAAGGVDVAESTKVVDMLQDGGRVAGVVAVANSQRHRLTAGLVVGADGLRSVVARRLGLIGSGGSTPKVALTAHWTGMGDLHERGELHFRGPAVVGIAPVGRGAANVTLVLPGAAARALRGDQAIALRRWPGLAERFTAARLVDKPLATGPFDQRVRAVTAPGALLAGDAAGYFDPLTGQGIYRALRSAELAAAHILHGATYEGVLQAEFAPAVRLQRLLDGLVRRPAALAGGLGLLRICPPAGRWLVGHTGDCYH